MFSKDKDADFPFGYADAVAVDGRRVSNVYRVAVAVRALQAPPGGPGLSIQQTAERKDAASDARHKHAAKSKRVRKTAPRSKE